MRNKKWLFLLTALLITPAISTAQQRASDSVEVYHIRPLLSLGGSLSGVVLIRYGRDRNMNKSALSEQELDGLINEEVNVFDRIALRQDISKSEQVAGRSDAAQLASTLLPFLIFWTGVSAGTGLILPLFIWKHRPSTLCCILGVLLGRCLSTVFAQLPITRRYRWRTAWEDPSETPFTAVMSLR